ncbi:hypothetical protein [Parvularcula sp. LCG005]|uniref:hypothetical protein n=1 Tax=Parvularcula sp. LCG005 TaxID=3078805 RepID=UPI002942150B|nr:hypothetical protein [Parvularcula sp. LCG005]WOI53914.1 hypothetical protein RUI03_02665 [Parvularcula sp. LCG005]
MLKKLVGVAAGAAALSGNAPAEEERPYEVVSGTIDGRLTMAIVNIHGAAIVVELNDEDPEIIRGLAAGAILSDLRDAAGQGDNLLTVSSGVSQSEVLLDRELKTGFVSVSETLQVIDSLPTLSESQRNELRSMVYKQ